MVFCTNCGAQIGDNTKFCHECGTPNANASTVSAQRQQEFAGKIIKCPNCGESLNSFVTVCPSCNYELRGSKAADTLKAFESQYSKLIKPQEKIDLIKTFAIPNTKEDVLEFMILASANIDPDAFEVDKYNNIDARVSNAWIAKMEQAYQKAQLLFEETPEFLKIQKLYLRQKRTISVAKESSKKTRKTEKRQAWFEKNKSWIGKTALFVVFFAILFLMPSIMFLPQEIKHKSLDNKLESLVEQVEQSIYNEEWQAARIKANQIIMDDNWSTESKEKWNSVRESLIEEIEEAQGKAEGKLTVGYKSQNLVGQNFEDVVSKLKAKGFTNIQTVRLNDLKIGWFKKDGEVSEISISGDTDFNDNSKYVSNTEIKITYHSYKDR